MSKLAIVIPAFKEIYFEKAIQSIADQTSKDFTLYIGDDSSPYDLKTIADRFKDKIQIVYKRFDENFGGTNLVGQWERCIDMVRDEEWIWLFSDDDMMDKNCVADFYNARVSYPDFDVFHFNVHTINQDDNIVRSFNFPEFLTSEEYFFGRYQLGYHSFVVEYIFRKSHFNQMGRFENFDLGWGSDDALWIKLSNRKGIKTIGTSTVYWRRSPHNISPNYKDKNILVRKFQARIQFAGWAVKQAEMQNIRLEEKKLRQMLERVFVENMIISSDILSFKMINDLLSKFFDTLTKSKPSKKKLVHIYFHKIRRSLVKKIKNTFAATLQKKEALG